MEKLNIEVVKDNVINKTGNITEVNLKSVDLSSNENESIACRSGIYCPYSRMTVDGHCEIQICNWCGKKLNDKDMVTISWYDYLLKTGRTTCEKDHSANIVMCQSCYKELQ